MEIRTPDMGSPQMMYSIDLGESFVRLCNMLQEDLIQVDSFSIDAYQSVVETHPFEIVGVGGTRIVCRYTEQTPTDTSYVIKFTIGEEHSTHRPQLPSPPITYVGEYQSIGEQLLNSYLTSHSKPEREYFAPLVIPTGVRDISPLYGWVMMEEYTSVEYVYKYVDFTQFSESLFPIVERYGLDGGVNNIGVDLSWSDEYSPTNPPEQHTDAFYRSLYFIDYGLFNPAILTGDE